MFRILIFRRFLGELQLLEIRRQNKPPIYKVYLRLLDQKANPTNYGSLLFQAFHLTSANSALQNYKDTTQTSVHFFRNRQCRLQVVRETTITTPLDRREAGRRDERNRSPAVREP